MSRQLLEKKAGKILHSILIECLKIPALRKKMKSDSGEWIVEVQIVNSVTIRKLNADYLNHNYVTDVLSFPSDRFHRRRGFLGELFICESVLKRQAKNQKHSVQTELTVLLVHGLLHLLGFDHEKNKKTEKEMHQWEKKLLLSEQVAEGLIGRHT